MFINEQQSNDREYLQTQTEKYIEIRSLDTCEWDCHCGGPAFYTGLLYGNLNEAYDIINKCYQKAHHYINLASNSLSVFKDCEEKNILENLTSFSISRDF